ncbi:hypothetical protein RF55_21021 [Lasius niger]|uniref:Uncharacterized protein n=1 Tax=Lasius niger TaxID=67767 RepID=A0A0J7MRD7_LASNI|nr:hypothetical protein RF55_21021 [Lasius niger]
MKEYKKWKTVERPKYLRKKGKGKRLKTIARFRCCNEWRGDEYWEENSKKEYRLCGGKEETLQHVVKECPETEVQGTMEETAMSEGGEGIEWMLKVSSIREKEMWGKERKMKQEEERREREVK